MAYILFSSRIGNESLSAVDRLPIAWLLFAVFLGGLYGSFFSPAFRAVRPKLVPRELLQPANALLNIARDGTLIVSPGILALLLMRFHSERDIFLFPALTYLVSAISLSPMGFSVNGKTDREKAVKWSESFREDFSDIVITIKIIGKAGPLFRAMVANIVSIVCNTVGWEVALPILVKSHLGPSIVNYGEIVGALSFGSVVFGFLLGMFPMNRRLPTIFVGISLWGIGLALIGVGHNLMFAVVGAILMALRQAFQGLYIIVLLQQTYSEHVASIFSGYHGLQYAGNVGVNCCRTSSYNHSRGLGNNNWWRSNDLGRAANTFCRKGDEMAPYRPFPRTFLDNRDILPYVRSTSAITEECHRLLTVNLPVW